MDKIDKISTNQRAGNRSRATIEILLRAKRSRRFDSVDNFGWNWEKITLMSRICQRHHKVQDWLTDEKVTGWSLVLSIPHYDDNLILWTELTVKTDWPLCRGFLREMDNGKFQCEWLYGQTDGMYWGKNSSQDEMNGSWYECSLFFSHFNDILTRHSDSTSMTGWLMSDCFHDNRIHASMTYRLAQSCFYDVMANR